MSLDAENTVSSPSKAVPVAPNGSVAGDGIAELRRILVEPDGVGEVLPSAIRTSAGRDGRLAEATLPVVEENIRISAQRNPRILAEAIFPIIGPAIRKAIAEALSQMVQSLNQTLDHSISPRGLKWRLEAMRTGKPFAEIVLLNTLLYRVEQVFLIHRETGALLEHVMIPGSAVEDSEMVSAMLTAIQDFVHDSFKESEDATLNALRVRDLAVWIEHGPDAILAAVIRGNAPLGFRETLAETIESVHFEFENEFRDFKGDSEPFDRAQPILERCLKYQLGSSGSPGSGILTPLNGLAAIIGLILLGIVFFVVRDQIRWSDLLTRLKSEPGLVVVESDRGFFRHSVFGLRDEFAADPEALRAAAGYDADDVEQSWKAFQDTAPQFVVERARRLLAPPEGVTLSYENGVILADGLPSRAWLSEARKFAPALNGVRSIHPGFGALKRAIESEKVGFVCGTTDLEASDAGAVRSLVYDFEDLARVSEVTGKPFRVEIEGLADPPGGDELNARISRARADKILEELFARSAKLRASAANFQAVGAGSVGGQSVCGVRFRVIVDEK